MNRNIHSTAGTRPARLVSAGLAACALLALGSIAGCAYTQTMNERNAENQRLQSELQYEQGRNRELSR